MIRLHKINDRFRGRYPRLIAFGIISLSVAGLLTHPTDSKAARYSQELEKLNRFVQTSGGSDAEATIFREGRDLISDESWNKAADKFREYVRKYPKGKDTDAALYWLAFSLKKQERFQDARRSLERLINDYPKSKWRDDANTMLVEMAPTTGTQPSPAQINQYDDET